MGRLSSNQRRVMRQRDLLFALVYLSFASSFFWKSACNCFAFFSTLVLSFFASISWLWQAERKRRRSEDSWWRKREESSTECFSLLCSLHGQVPEAKPLHFTLPMKFAINSRDSFSYWLIQNGLKWKKEEKKHISKHKKIQSNSS